mmetsp:Transcript_59266/g.125999  ORF Transcript_59266/g.125999 Transcript_59266/m.125999 type:complete len:212 (+) Transcript_59266:756-1391(+)
MRDIFPRDEIFDSRGSIPNGAFVVAGRKPRDVRGDFAALARDSVLRPLRGHELVQESTRRRLARHVLLPPVPPVVQHPPHDGVRYRHALPGPGQRHVGEAAFLVDAVRRHCLGMGKVALRPAGEVDVVELLPLAAMHRHDGRRLHRDRSRRPRSFSRQPILSLPRVRPFVRVGDERNARIVERFPNEMQLFRRPDHHGDVRQVEQLFARRE